MIIAYYTDGSREQFNEMPLEKAQEIVEGYVELVTLNNIQLLINEEGLLHNLPLNKEVTFILKQNYALNFSIVGNAIILTKHHLWT